MRSTLCSLYALWVKLLLSNTKSAEKCLGDCYFIGEKRVRIFRVSFMGKACWNSLGTAEQGLEGGGTAVFPNHVVKLTPASPAASRIQFIRGAGIICSLRTQIGSESRARCQSESIVRHYVFSSFPHSSYSSLSCF